MSAKPLTPIFGELEQTAIENGYWGHAELAGVEITASFSVYRGGTTMKFRDTVGGSEFQCSGIDGDQIEQVARIIVAGICAERPNSERSSQSNAEPGGSRNAARLPQRP